MLFPYLSSVLAELCSFSAGLLVFFLLIGTLCKEEIDALDVVCSK